MSASGRTCYRCGDTAGVVGLPPARPVFCCAGCLLATQVPKDAQGNFPINAALVTALVVGFAYFNQLMLWGLAAKLGGQGKAAAAGLCALASLGAGAAVWLAASRDQYRAAGGVKPLDGAIAAFALALLLAGVSTRSPVPAVFGNALLLGWDFRGLLKQKKGP